MGQAAPKIDGSIDPARTPTHTQIPKLLWIKTHLPTVYNDPATRYYDLADYLSLRLVGTIPALLPDRDDDARSLCCVGAKWMYDTAGGQWWVGL